MTRLDPRALLLIPLLALTGCGGDDDPAPVEPPPPSSVAPPSAPAPSGAQSAPPSGDAQPGPDESVYVEEDEEPVEEPGALSPEGQSLLDEALGVELAALETAGEQGKARKAALAKLPGDTSKVLAALRTYSWWSPEAKTLYDKAVATQK